MAPPAAHARLAALFAALLACGCASSAWERTEAVAGGRLYIPRVYAPLLPGSIYPNKKVQVPAKGRPAIVVVCPATGTCPEDRILGPLAERGFVVLLFERAPKDPPREDLLRTRPEAAGAPQGWLLVEPTGDFLRRCMNAGAMPAAVAILQSSAPDPAAFPSPSSLSKQIFNGASRRVLLEALLGSEANTPFEGVIEKLYAPDAAGRLPREAYRDAAEWLAGELGAR